MSRLRRWRLLLGGDDADGTGQALDATDQGMDEALSQLYDEGQEGHLGSSAPRLTRWLGDIRRYFPSPVVQVMQQDALERLGLQRMLLEPELLASVQPDVHLVATLLGLSSAMSTRTRDSARTVIRKVVQQLEEQLAEPLRQAVKSGVRQAIRQHRPRWNDVDWPRTIYANLKHYQPHLKTIIPETRIGFGRRQARPMEVCLCVDQSGSMATSVVYAGVLACVLAGLPRLRTRLVVFDTSVVDLTDLLSDPVDVLFGTQLGGGTDINRAVAYCQGLMASPAETTLLVISDLYEGGDRKSLLRRCAALIGAGVQLIVLLALSDDGVPRFDHTMAAQLVGLGAVCFACTPEQFAPMMAAALQRRDLTQWAAEQSITVTYGDRLPAPENRGQ